MKNQRFVKIFSLLITITLSGFGYAQSSTGYFQSRYISFQSNFEDARTAIETKTKISKDVLKKRLVGKNVRFIESSDKILNPLILMLKIVRGGSSPEISLNKTDYALSELIQKLQSILKEREENDIFQTGTNVVDKRVTLAVGKTDITFYNRKDIYVEDLENLIDELHKQGIDQIYVSFA